MKNVHISCNLQCLACIIFLVHPVTIYIIYNIFMYFNSQDTPCTYVFYAVYLRRCVFKQRTCFCKFEIEFPLFGFPNFLSG